jgi:hypothetical protein
MGIRQIALCVLFFAGFQLTNAKAIVLASSDSATNTSDSRTGLPLDHTGLVNNGESGVYLGDYHGKSWVLAANHGGPGSFELGGITLHEILGSDE